MSGSTRRRHLPRCPLPFPRCRDRLSAHRGRERTRNTKRHSIHRRRRARACDPSLARVPKRSACPAPAAPAHRLRTACWKFAAAIASASYRGGSARVGLPVAMTPPARPTAPREEYRTRARRESPVLAEPALIGDGIETPYFNNLSHALTHQNDRCPIWWWHQPVEPNTCMSVVR